MVVEWMCWDWGFGEEGGGLLLLLNSLARVLVLGEHHVGVLLCLLVHSLLLPRQMNLLLPVHCERLENMKGRFCACVDFF